MRHLIVLPLIFFAVSSVFSQSKTEASISNAANRLEPKTIAWRRDFHQHPELGNREVRTAKIVADHLRALGLEVKENVGKTGVVGILRGKRPGPCVGLRADMDALPIQERSTLPFASQAKAIYNGQETGVMHACGHDTHVAMLMTVAEILAGMKDQINGNVKFVFQPAEEGPPAGEEGGAPLMIKEGVMDDPKVDVMFGLHINSATEVGTIKYRVGGMMAAADEFRILVKGKGSHGSQPWLSIDPITVSAQIIMGLQTIISRQTELTKNAAVITVGAIKGGLRFNIIPEEVELIGTIRTLDTKMRELIHQKINLTATKIAESVGATADVKIDQKTLVTYNDPSLTERMVPTLERTVGKGNLKVMDAVLGGEDFSYFGTKAPALFLYLGGMKKGQDPATAFPHHTADFVIDETGMKTGVRTLCNLVMDYLNQESTHR